MMEKNWLIRTKQNQILGPVAKEKILEFVSKGALKDEDELCSGNGFWFRMSEHALVNRYLWGDEIQPFNPVSECVSRLCKNELFIEEKYDFEESDPSDDTPITQVINIKNIQGQFAPQKKSDSSNSNKVSNNDDLSESKLPSNDDLAYPELNQLKGSTMAQKENLPRANSRIANNNDEMTDELHLHQDHDHENPQLKKNEDLDKGLEFEINQQVESGDPVVYPDTSDLDYPDPDLKPPARK